MLTVVPRLRVASWCYCALLACPALGCGKTVPAAAEESHPAPVKAVAARTAVLGEWTELLGTTQPLPNRVARVSAAVEGHVLSVLGEGQGPTVAEGEPIKAGQLVVLLDDRIARANRDKVAAQLTELEEQKKQAQLTVDLAGIEVKRLEELTKGGKNGGLALVSRVELDKARISRKDAESKQVGLAAKQAGLDADLKGLDAHLDFYKLRAPIAGRLGLLQVMPGQTIPAGTSVAEVIDLDEIDVLCFAPPHVTARLALGQPARIATEPKAAGKVVYIAVQAQPETGNFAVKVRFPNKDLALRANTVVRVHVQTRPDKERLAIPDSALIEDQDPPLVVVVREVKEEKNAEGKVEKLGKARKLRAVLGVRDRDRHLVEIVRLEGLEKGEQVPLQDVLFITEGGHGLHDDDVVKLEEDHAKEKE